MAPVQVLMVSADYKWNLRNLEWGTEEYRSTMKQVQRLCAAMATTQILPSIHDHMHITCPSHDHAQIHQRSALRLREMCRSNAGLFIKVGQHIGSLEYLLPTEYVKTFKVFHSRAPATPLWRLKEVVREEFGVPGVCV